MTSLKNKVANEFTQRFREAPHTIVRAPGRVNLIGEHTDYNDGFVLPMAIDRASWIALRPRNDKQVKLYSIGLDQQTDFSLDELVKQSETWSEYIKGTHWALQEAGYKLVGWEGVLVGNIPIGAGLSSSASLELAVARASLSVTTQTWQAKEMALTAQKAENEWVGVNCGIMDQMISATGEEGHALLIDCRSLDLQLVPLPNNTVIVVMDTNTRRGLVDSAYNERRDQCEIASQFFNVPALRDVDLQTFQQKGDGLDPLIYKRAKHIITENDRVLKTQKAMIANNPITVGKLFNESHKSLCDDFEVSSRELNIMVEEAQKIEGCYGARMTGAGFGGCAVAIVNDTQIDHFTKTIAQNYQIRTNIKPNIYNCKATNGAEIITK